MREQPFADIRGIQCLFRLLCDIRRQNRCISHFCSRFESPPRLSFHPSDIKPFSKIKASFHVGPDDLSPALFKFRGADIPMPLPNLFYVSLNRGTFRHKWKILVFASIHKNGPKQKPSNNRPITHTSVFSSIVKKINKRRLTSYFLHRDPINAGERFPPKQAMFYLHDWFLKHGAQGCQRRKPVVVFLDMRNAFDRVSHRKLSWKSEATVWQPPCWLGSPLIWHIECR